MWGLVRCLWTLSSRASCLQLALLALTGDGNPMHVRGALIRRILLEHMEEAAAALASVLPTSEAHLHSLLCSQDKFFAAVRCRLIGLLPAEVAAQGQDVPSTSRRGLVTKVGAP